MAAQVVIELVPDASKVQTALDQIGNGGAEGAAAANGFKQQNAALAENTKIKQANAVATKALDQAEQKNLKTIGDLGKAITRVADGVVEISGPEFANAMKANGLSAEQLIGELGKLTTETQEFKNEEKSTIPVLEQDKKATMSLRGEKRLLTEQIGRLIAAGEQNSQQFRDLVARAGELDDAMSDASDAIRRTGSDTRGLDNAVLAMNGVAAGFAGITSAAALFGSENEDVEKILVKVNAAMGILNAAQAIQTLLKSEYVKTLIASITATKANTVATTAEATAIEGATVAQTELNAAMSANPILAIITLLLAAVAAYQLYAANADDGADAQQRFNDAIDTEPLEQYNTELDRSFAITKALAKLYGESEVAILKLEKAQITASMRATSAKSAEIQATLAAGNLDIEQKKAAIAALQQVTELQKQNIQNLTLNGIAIRQAEKDAAEKAAEDQKKRNETAAAERKKAADDAEKTHAATVAFLNERDEFYASENKRRADEQAKRDADYAKQKAEDEEKLRQERLQKETELAQALEALQVASLNARLGARQRAAADITKGAKDQIAAEQEVFNERIRQNESAQIELTNSLLNRSISYEEYEAGITKLQEDGEKIRFENQQANAKREIETRRMVQGAILQLASQAAAAAFEVAAQYRQQELDAQLGALDKRKDQELNNKNLTEQQKKQIQDKYDREAARIKTEAAKKERKAKILEATVNAALAVLSAMTAPWPANIILAVAAGVAGALQVAKIAATPLPQYAKGVRNAPPGYAIVGEEGPELINLKGGEDIHTAPETRRILEGYRFADNSENIRYDAEHPSGGMSYDEIGRAVARHMPAPQHVTMNADQDGLTIYLATETSRRTIRNKRYTTAPNA